MNRFLVALALLPVACVAQADPVPSVRGVYTLGLSALMGGSVQSPASGLHWRVYKEAAESDGSHLLVAE